MVATAPEIAGDNSLADWLRLQLTDGIGPQTARKLLNAFGLPENIFSASFADLRLHVSEKVAQALSDTPAEALQTAIARSLEWANQRGNAVITLADEAYPHSLLEIHDPPLILYAKGRTDLLTKPGLAIVGSRNATAQGLANAEKFSQALAQAGWTIASGLALGIDTSAHQGALGTPASTIAVIGTGADIVYPARNRALAHRIAEEGCILSEYPLGTPAIASNFPRRNRIISGLARGVLVVEAAAQSGSLITARMAAEQGREVFAIPGSIHSPLAKGCHQLIKQGAKLVESAQDVLEELNGITAASTTNSQIDTIPSSKTDTDSNLLTAMGYDPVHVDVLAARCHLDMGVVQAELLALELAGSIERLPGDVYRRMSSF